MRLIDADKLIAKFMNNALDYFDYYKGMIESLPTIDIVICEECKKHCDCERILAMTTCYNEIEDYAELNFCSNGERKDNE